MAKRITLYQDENPYESEDIYVEIAEHEIRFYEITSEHAPGGRYGILHKLDQENTEKLLQCLSDGTTRSAEDLFRPFCGKDAVRSFKAFCKANAIAYTSFLVS